MDEIDPQLLAQFKKCYPSLSADKLKEAAENLIRYTELINRIYERIRNNPEAYQTFKIMLEEKKKGKSSF